MKVSNTAGSIRILITLALAVLLGGGGGLAPHAQASQPTGFSPIALAPAPGSVGAALTLPLDDGRGTPFIFEKVDSICGNNSANGITRPCTVDYDALMDATKEVREIKKRKIDPNGAKGRTLMTAARNKVRKACEDAYKAGGHCGVWKRIERRDGKPIVDITAQVKAKLAGK